MDHALHCHKVIICLCETQVANNVHTPFTLSWHMHKNSIQEQDMGMKLSITLAEAAKSIVASSNNLKDIAR